ncbi:phosphatidylserine decarboxylase [Rhodococcus aerolatus]
MARRPRPARDEATAPLEHPGPAREGLDPGHVLALVREAVPPLHPAGLPFVVAPAVVGLLGRRSRLVRRTATATALACATFFRHPARVPPTRRGVAVAPADGTVALVDTAVPPAELGLGPAARPRVSVFLSVLDVHVQRSPVGGRVVDVHHTPGAFLSADLPEASERNERTALLLRTTEGDHEVVVVQIAGLLARRIVCSTAPGATLARGETYGLIRFGSRVDTYLPEGSRLLVEVGQRTVGAETVLGELP